MSYPAKRDCGVSQRAKRTRIERIIKELLKPRRIMKTAILVFILIVIAVAIFYLGIIVGGWAIGKRLADATGRAIDASDLTSEQKYNLLDAIQKEAKK